MLKPPRQLPPRTAQVSCLTRRNLQVSILILARFHDRDKSRVTRVTSQPLTTRLDHPYDTLNAAEARVPTTRSTYIFMRPWVTLLRLVPPELKRPPPRPAT